MIVLHIRFLPQSHPFPCLFTVAVAKGRAIPQSRTGAEALPRVQMVMEVSSSAPKSSAADSQCTRDSVQQFHLQGKQLLLQGRTYLIRGFNLCMKVTTNDPGQLFNGSVGLNAARNCWNPTLVTW